MTIIIYKENRIFFVLYNVHHPRNWNFQSLITLHWYDFNQTINCIEHGHSYSSNLITDDQTKRPLFKLSSSSSSSFHPWINQLLIKQWYVRTPTRTVQKWKQCSLPTALNRNLSFNWRLSTLQEQLTTIGLVFVIDFVVQGRVIGIRRSFIHPFIHHPFQICKLLA